MSEGDTSGEKPGCPRRISREASSGVTIGLVSPGAATDGCHPIFLENI